MYETAYSELPALVKNVIGEEKTPATVTAYKKDFVTAEMHHNLLTDFDRIDRYYADVWDRLIPDGECTFRMSEGDFYIYHPVHTGKHFAHGGTGIRSAPDTFVYLSKKTDMDMAYVRTELDKIALWDFHLALAMAENTPRCAPIPARASVLLGGTHLPRRLWRGKAHGRRDPRIGTDRCRAGKTPLGRDDARGFA